MKIRTALVLACFLLSVVPLAGIVTYSYFSSRRALESAYHAEAARLTGQMDRRLAGIRDVVQQRLAEVSALPDLPNATRATDRILMTIGGDVAPLVRSLEIQPMPTPDPPAKAAESATTAPPAPSAPVVISVPPLPEMPKMRLGDTERAQLRRISELSRQLGLHAGGLTPGERAQIQEQINDAQRKFNEAMSSQQTKYAEELAQRIIAGTPHPASVREAMKSIPEDLIFGNHFNVPVTQDGAVVGRIHAHLSDEAIRRVLAADEGDDSEITFAVDRQGHLYTRSDEERKTLDDAGIVQRIGGGKPTNDLQNWVVAMKQDPQSGLRIGVARPYGHDFDELRNTAGKNFGYGIVLIFVAMIGIVPVANHMTRDVQLVTRGADRIAHGDLTTRLPVRSGNEIGQLAAAFNRMAHDLSLQQQTIVQQERAAVEYQRKSAELEEARRFQLSMLPKEVPQHPCYDIAVFTHTAAEVGGDYYDFHSEGTAMSVTIGDATGHGARAGTMVAVIKALFAGYTGGQTPAEFLREAATKVRRMDLARMAMALQIARFDGNHAVLASAGMPPAYLHRHADGAIEEISIGATPLGTLGNDYQDVSLRLDPGDTLLFMSDGFPELMNPSGQQLGYSAAVRAFAEAARTDSADSVIASLSAAAHDWRGEQPPNDDVTFVVVRARA
jgi:serine phosphatase RsbU (regulator of sigma subunit)